jgi:hypothetical protein
MTMVARFTRLGHDAKNEADHDQLEEREAAATRFVIYLAHSHAHFLLWGRVFGAALTHPW